MLTHVSSPVGPRFANVFIEDAAKREKSITTDADFKCIFNCAGNVIKLAPCIVTAVATENPVALLSCGVNKGSVRVPLSSGRTPCLLPQSSAQMSFALPLAIPHYPKDS